MRRTRPAGAAALAAAWAVAGAGFALGANEPLPRGKLVERLACRTNPEQTYALYLPSGYDATRQWPILYVFDPGARGARGAAQFQGGAEASGFLVAASNNSKNGPVEPSLAAAQAVIEDTHERLAIDDRRIYTAGFSGGARIATLVAQLLKTPVAGVIACSGGFPEGRPPGKETPFAWFGTAGDADFNYGEMVSLDAALEKLDVPHRLAIFPGRHQWAPEPVCAEALSWMRLREAARKLVDDPELVARSFARRLVAARDARAAGRLVEADRELHAMDRDYRTLRDTAGIEAEIAALERDPAYGKAAASAAKRAAEERAATEGVLRRFDALASDQPPALARLLADLDLTRWKKRAASANAEDALAARRVLATLFFHALVTAPQEFLARRDYRRAIESLSVATEVQPDAAAAWYNRACAEARAGQERPALEDLRAAVAKGFRDRAAMESDDDLASLRGKAEFRSLVESLPVASAKPGAE